MEKLKSLKPVKSPEVLILHMQNKDEPENKTLLVSRRAAANSFLFKWDF